MQEFSFKYKESSVGFYMNNDQPVFNVSMGFPDAMFSFYRNNDGLLEMAFYFRPIYRVKYYGNKEYITKFAEREVYYPIISNLFSSVDLENLDFHVKNVDVYTQMIKNSLNAGASFSIIFTYNLEVVNTHDLIKIKQKFIQAFKSYLADVPAYDKKAYAKELEEHKKSLTPVVLEDVGDLPF